ncbi:MAG: hypothetical protein KJ630_03615 [Proteobacteria bacterium]|nr:hypothetical protein [Pseudomonadota bacterium]
MIQIFNDSGIVIRKKIASFYQLSSNHIELSWNNNTIVDPHGSIIMSFKPKGEMFWDIKLLLKNKVSIGSCLIGLEKYPVYIQGISNQKIFYREDCLVSINKSVLSLEKMFENQNIEHLSLLLILAVYNDRKK